MRKVSDGNQQLGSALKNGWNSHVEAGWFTPGVGQEAGKPLVWSGGSEERRAALSGNKQVKKQIVQCFECRDQWFTFHLLDSRVTEGHTEMGHDESQVSESLMWQKSMGCI